jgi:hypothetical protein
MNLLPAEEDCLYALGKLGGASVTWDYVRELADRPHAEVRNLVRLKLIEHGPAIGEKPTYRLTEYGIEVANKLIGKRK